MARTRAQRRSLANAFKKTVGERKPKRRRKNAAPVALRFEISNHAVKRYRQRVHDASSRSAIARELREAFAAGRRCPGPPAWIDARLTLPASHYSPNHAVGKSPGEASGESCYLWSENRMVVFALRWVHNRKLWAVTTVLIRDELTTSTRSRKARGA